MGELKMFCARNTKTKEIINVYDISKNKYGQICFLIFNNGWSYVDARNYEPINKLERSVMND